MDEPILGEWLLPLPWARPPMLANDRLHFRERNARSIRIAADVEDALSYINVPPMARAEITLYWRPGDLRRRDADGPEQSKKAAIDALVRAGILPDDSWRQVPRSWCEIVHPEPKTPGTCWLVIRRLPDVEDDPNLWDQDPLTACRGN